MYNGLEELENEIKRELENIEDKCVLLFKEAIIRRVYNAYSPKVYTPTDQLLNMVKSEIKSDGLYISVNVDSMDYFSAVSGNHSVTPAVPWFVQEGHMSRHSETTDNQYTNYEGRKYLEMAKQLIDREFNIDVEIINEQPSWVKW